MTMKMINKGNGVYIEFVIIKMKKDCSRNNIGLIAVNKGNGKKKDYFSFLNQNGIFCFHFRRFLHHSMTRIAFLSIFLLYIE